jgi:hypothetical protein
MRGQLQGQTRRDAYVMLEALIFTIEAFERLPPARLSPARGGIR